MKEKEIKFYVKNGELMVTDGVSSFKITQEVIDLLQEKYNNFSTKEEDNQN